MRLLSSGYVSFLVVMHETNLRIEILFNIVSSHCIYLDYSCLVDILLLRSGYGTPASSRPYLVSLAGGYTPTCLPPTASCLPHIQSAGSLVCKQFGTYHKRTAAMVTSLTAIQTYTLIYASCFFFCPCSRKPLAPPCFPVSIEGCLSQTNPSTDLFHIRR